VRMQEYTHFHSLSARASEQASIEELGVVWMAADQTRKIVLHRCIMYLGDGRKETFVYELTDVCVVGV